MGSLADSVPCAYRHPGAGDQGIMFGYACNETKGYMPLAISIAHSLVEYATEKRQNGEFLWARPDMKSQVTIDYTDKNNTKIDTILMSIQHDGDYNEQEFKNYVENVIIKDVVNEYGMNDDYKVMILPDHPTPVSERTHTRAPVPFVVYDSEKELAGMEENAK